MNCMSWIETHLCCCHCGKPMHASKHYHGYISEYNYYLSCSESCYLDRDLEDDNSLIEISRRFYYDLIKYVRKYLMPF